MTVVIETARPEDAEALDALMARCSTETRYRRFFAPVRALPVEYRNGVLAGDPATHDAVVLHASGMEIVALASLVSAPESGAAELGVLVEDGWQRRGFGTALVAELVARARARGVPYLRATVQPRATGLLIWLGRILPLERSEYAAGGVTGIYRLL